jgi:MFS transporter, MHS family, proline/betaine transporter
MNIPNRTTPKQRFIILATILGNSLEWFDFILFGMMAPFFINLFLPQSLGKSPYLYPGLMAIVAIARPIGGFIFGTMGDKKGRKVALVRTICFMIIPLFLAALLPSYKESGLVAAFLFVLMFVLQGISLGGEFPGAVVFLIESAKKKTLGYIGSFAYFGIFIGMFFAMVEVNLLNTEVSPEALRAGEWRIPFFLSGMVGIVVLLLRRLLRETPFFEEAKHYGCLLKEPLFNTFHKYKKMIFIGMGLMVMDTVGFNLVLIYSSFYSTSVLQLSYFQSMVLQFFTIILFLVTTLFAGRLSDYVGIHRFAKWALWTLFLLASPIYILMGWKIYWLLFLTQGVLAVLIASYFSVLPVLVSSLFPIEIRYSGTATAMNFAIAIFGGLGPFIMVRVIGQFQSPIWPSLYLMIGCAISLFSLACVRNQKLSISKM